jgi:hypothetical protein
MRARRVVDTGRPWPGGLLAGMVAAGMAIGGLLAYATDAALESKAATWVLNLVIGLSIGSVVVGLGRASAHVVDEPYNGSPYDIRSRGPHGDRLH